MDKVEEWKDIVLQSLSSMWLEMTKIIPSIIGVFVILVVGWLFTKLLVKIVKKALKVAKVNKLDDILNDIEIVEGKKLSFDTIKIVSNFVKWVMYIMLIIMASDVLDLKIISEEIGHLFSYLPQLFASLVIFVLGLVFANFIKKGIRSFFESMDLSGAKIISQVVFFLILVFVGITALNQAGINTEIITQNLTLILGALLVAFSLAFGLGAKGMVSDLLRMFYVRKTYELGKKIEFKGEVYEIEVIENISVTLIRDNEKLIVPIKDIVETQIKIKN
ncbi:mechanosensitive ion channel family protein [Lacinutrix undariae]